MDAQISTPWARAREIGQLPAYKRAALVQCSTELYGTALALCDLGLVTIAERDPCRCVLRRTAIGDAWVQVFAHDHAGQSQLTDTDWWLLGAVLASDPDGVVAVDARAWRSLEAAGLVELARLPRNRFGVFARPRAHLHARNAQAAYGTTDPPSRCRRCRRPADRGRRKRG